MIVFVLSLFAQTYPKPTGFVNDWAGLLSPNAKQTLEERLRDYEKLTSIEVAVVITPSLDGESVEDYSIKLAQAWGVGKKGKDNGMLFLVAPNERKLRIEVGYGLEPDFPDSRAGEVRDRFIIPHFMGAKAAKESGNEAIYVQEMSAGVVGGVDGIIGALGTKPFANRLEERKHQEEEARRRAAENLAAMKGALLVLLVVLAIGIPIVLIVKSIQRGVRRKAKLLEIQESNRKRGDKLNNDLRAIQGAEYEKAKAALARISRANPKEVWAEDQDALLNRVPSITGEAKKSYDEFLHTTPSGLESAQAAASLLSSVESRVGLCREIFSRINSLEAEIQNAKEKSQKLINSFDASMEDLERKAKNPDVLTDVRPNAYAARAKFEEAEKLSGATMPNWLLVLAAATAATETVSKAGAALDNDIASVSEAKKNIPTLTKSIPGKIVKAQKAVSDDDVSSSTKDLVAKAKRKYDEAEERTDQSPAGLVGTFVLLAAAAGLLEKAVSQAEDEVEEEARRKRRARESSCSSSSYGSGSSWSSGSSGGSSFGGFGGGSFGGGGASGGW
jgi:uncharacterized membrane protein YgcG